MTRKGKHRRAPVPVEPEDLRAVAAVAVAPQRARVNDEATAPRLGVVEPEARPVHWVEPAPGARRGPWQRVRRRGEACCSLPLGGDWREGLSAQGLSSGV